MKTQTQFKINSVEDIKKHYDKYHELFLYSLDEELQYFNNCIENEDLYMSCFSSGNCIMSTYDENQEVVPNPYLFDNCAYYEIREENSGLSKILQQAKDEAEKLGFDVEIKLTNK